MQSLERPCAGLAAPDPGGPPRPVAAQALSNFPFHVGWSRVVLGRLRTLAGIFAGTFY